MNMQTYPQTLEGHLEIRDTWMSEPRHHSAAAPADSEMQVWTNCKSGIFHFPGQRWSGKTKSGRYISGEIALKSGNRPTRNGQ